MSVVNPILFTEMKAFFDLQGFYPTPHEMTIIEALDAITVAHYAKKKPTKPTKGK